MNYKEAKSFVDQTQQLIDAGFHLPPEQKSSRELAQAYIEKADALLEQLIIILQQKRSAPYTVTEKDIIEAHLKSKIDQLVNIFNQPYADNRTIHVDIAETTVRLILLDTENLLALPAPQATMQTHAAGAISELVGTDDPTSTPPQDDSGATHVSADHDPQDVGNEASVSLPPDNDELFLALDTAQPDYRHLEGTSAYSRDGDPDAAHPTSAPPTQPSPDTRSGGATAAPFAVAASAASAPTTDQPPQQSTPPSQGPQEDTRNDSCCVIA